MGLGSHFEEFASAFGFDFGDLDSWHQMLLHIYIERLPVIQSLCVYI